MKKIINLLTMFMFFTFAQFSIAGIPLLYVDAKAVEEIYGGLKWSFNSGSKKPEIIVGYKKTNVDIFSIHDFQGSFLASNHMSINGIDGSDISLSIDLEKLKVSSIRAKYFEGEASSQNELSVGWDFNRGPFIGASISAPYRTIGVDYFVESAAENNAFSPYLIINTLERVSLKYGENFNVSCLDISGTFDASVDLASDNPPGIGDVYFCGSP